MGEVTRPSVLSSPHFVPVRHPHSAPQDKVVGIRPAPLGSSAIIEHIAEELRGFLLTFVVWLVKIQHIRVPPAEVVPSGGCALIERTVLAHIKGDLALPSVGHEESSVKQKLFTPFDDQGFGYRMDAKVIVQAPVHRADGAREPAQVFGFVELPLRGGRNASHRGAPVDERGVGMCYRRCCKWQAVLPTTRMLLKVINIIGGHREAFLAGFYHWGWQLQPRVEHEVVQREKMAGDAEDAAPPVVLRAIIVLQAEVSELVH